MFLQIVDFNSEEEIEKYLRNLALQMHISLKETEMFLRNWGENNVVMRKSNNFHDIPLLVNKN